MKEKARSQTIFRRLLAIFAALALVLTMAGISASPVLAAGATTGTITIKPPQNTTSSTSTEYKIYKVFGATYNSSSAVSYDLITGKTAVPDVSSQYPNSTYNKETDNHFVLDSAGNVHYGTEKDSSDTNYSAMTIRENGNTTDATKTTYFKAASSSGELDSYTIAAIADYVKDDSATYTLTTTGTNRVEQSGVPFGYWYVTTQTGSAVSIGTNNPNATINDKNVIPTVTKKITSVEDSKGSVTTDGQAAIAQVGKKVNYTSTVVFNKGSKVISFHDVMGSNLSYNKDATVKIYKVSSTGTKTDVTDSVEFASTWKNQSDYFPANTPYVIRDGRGETKADTGDTITVDFPYNLDEQAGTGETIQAEISYSATVTSAALTVDPENNTAYVTYGDNNAKTSESKTYVYNAKIEVIKHDGSGSNLGGAEFVLKNSDGKYYQYSAATESASQSISWVDEASNATKLTSRSSDGKAVYKVNDDLTLEAFIGLPNGTYTLTETDTPAGYNTAADKTFTIDGVGSVTYTTATTARGESDTSGGELYKNSSTIENLNQGATVVNEAGSALPHTGGIGTTIFYAVGGLLVAGAVVLLVMRRRRAAEK